MVGWEPARDANGLEIAKSYKVYWSVNPNPGPGNNTGSSADLPSTDYCAFIKAFDNGSQLYFAVTAKLDGSESTPTNANVGSLVTVNPQSGGSTVSGTVDSSGITKSASTSLWVAVASQGAPMAIGAVQNPANLQSYSITGVPAGSYQLYAILDMNSNSSLDIGDIVVADSTAPTFTVASSNVTVNATLAPMDAETSVNTNHWREFSTSNEGYNLDFRVRARQRLAVNATITGPQFSEAATMGTSTNSRGGELQSWLGVPARPNLTDTYSLAVTYSTGAPSSVPVPISGIVDSFATPTSPVGYVTYPLPSPTTFAWNAPLPSPAPPIHTPTPSGSMDLISSTSTAINTATCQQHVFCHLQPPLCRWYPVQLDHFGEGQLWQ